jgi:uncharacterized membrane protein
MSTGNESLLVTLDPVWPWSIPVLGLWAFAILALLLVGLTVWTYRGVRKASSRRLTILVFLRLGALAVACMAVLRPSLALHEDPRVASVLLIAADNSQSMSIQDQHNNESRWDYLRHLLHESEPMLDQLRDEHNITVTLYSFAGDIQAYDPRQSADGKRTDFGEMLHGLYERHGNERVLRGLLVLSDGADNGTKYPALSLATRWRSLPCPIHTFGFGQKTTTSQQRDIILTGINPDPSPVAIKGKLTVRGTVDAPGFENANVRVRLLINDVEVRAADQPLPKTTGNIVQLECDAPADPGEIKVTLKIDPKTGETTVANNEISTYVTVTKEGISVLYVEGKFRAWEPKFIRYALAQDPNINLHEAIRLRDEPLRGEEQDAFEFSKQHYDVIILGDITAKRLSGEDARVPSAIYNQVIEKGSGLMMIGGYDSFGNSDWDHTDVAKVLPVTLDVTGQIDDPVRMIPTPEGLQHYVMRLADQPEENSRIWSKLAPLDGMTKLGQPKPGAVVLARSGTGEPVLVGQLQVGFGRSLAFAGDTSWRWRRTEEGTKAHVRFWQQAILWLAKRDQAEGNVVVLPDTRRLPTSGRLGFTVKLRGKGGVEVPEKDAHFEVNVIAPGGEKIAVPTARENGQERGNFWKTDTAGEYQMVARGWGKDSDGKPLADLPLAKARFLVYQDEAEMARQGADHEFLEKLASSGGGAFHQAMDLPQFLKDLAAQPSTATKAKAKLWPDWRRTPPARSAGAQIGALAGSGILICLVLFVAFLCTEWFLRRYWRLV